MNESGLRRRDLLIAVSGGCVTLAGCADGTRPDDSTAAATADQPGYGTAYGQDYGTETETK